MRAELYADSRDIWKWTVAIREARQRNQPIYWVVMNRPDQQEHGKDRSEVPGALPEVKTFFEQERRRIDVGESRDLTRIQSLSKSANISLEMNMDSYPKKL